MPAGVKLLSIRNADGTETLGAVTDKGVIDVRAVAAKRKIAALLTLPFRSCQTRHKYQVPLFALALE